MGCVSAVAAALVGPLVGGCGDEVVCDYAVCAIDEPACIKRIAEAVGCHLDRKTLYPEVRFISVEQYLAEVEADATPLTAEEQRASDDYLRALALVRLLPEGYAPASLNEDSLRGFAAFYTRTDRSIVMLTDRAAGDPQQDYLLLVHEMVHAYQDEAWDLEALSEAHAGTYDRFLGLRAFTEGYAVHFANLASIELEDLEPEQIDWVRYFDQWQTESLQQARQSATPALDVTAYFPYAFGGEFVLNAWQAGDVEALERLSQRPPDSTRQAIAGYYVWPDRAVNEDGRLDPKAVAVMPANYTLLNGGHEGVWSVNAMLQRTSYGPLWSPLLDDVSADYLAAWRWNDADVVAMWRLRSGLPGDLYTGLTVPGAWIPVETDVTTTHLATLVDGDVLLIAVSNGDARTVLADIAGWQSPEDAFMTDESAAARRAGRIDTRRLGCVHLGR